MMTSASIKTMAICLLCALTIPILTLYDRWEDIGGEMLDVAAFESGLDGWEYSKELVEPDSNNPGVNILSLKNNENYSYLYQTIENPKRYKYFTFSGEIKTEDIQKTANSAYVARLLFISRSDKGEGIWRIPHVLVKLKGSNEWARYEKTFKVYKEIKEIHVGAYLHRATGRMLVRNLSVRPADERRGYLIAQYLSICAWVIMALWIIPSFISFKEFSSPNFALLAIGLLIIGAIITPIEVLNYIVNLAGKSFAPIRDYIELIPNGATDHIGLHGAGLNKGQIVMAIHKVAHIFFFLFIGIVAPRLKPAIDNRRMIGYLVLFAIAAETMQLCTASREFSYFDMSLNLAGVMAGFLVYILIKFMRATPPHKPEAR